MLSIIFIIISLKIQNYYVLGASLTFIFLQLIAENDKDHYLKYKELFEKVKNGKKFSTYKDWICFLEKTKGLNSICRWMVGLHFNREFDKLMKEEKGKNKITPIRQK